MGVLAQVRKIEASTPIPKTPLRPGVNARVVPAPAEITNLRVFRLSHPCHYVQILLLFGCCVTPFGYNVEAQRLI